MKVLGTFLGVLLLASAAWAACSTHTIFMPRGTMITCTTCCYGSSCHTSCF
jgi:hypothetical protein